MPRTDISSTNPVIARGVTLDFCGLHHLRRNIMEAKLRERLLRLSTTNVSDALDSLGLKGTTCGILPVHSGCVKIAGEAVTLRLIPKGGTPPKTHLGIHAIEAAAPASMA